MSALDIIKPVLKAVVGFAAPAAVILTSSVTEGSAGGTTITSGEIITAICACVITSAAVWGVPNLPRKPAEPAGDTEPSTDA